MFNNLHVIKVSDTVIVLHLLGWIMQLDIQFHNDNQHLRVTTSVSQMSDSHCDIIILIPRFR